MKRRITVVLVAPTPPPYGGMALQAEALQCNLAREGTEAILVSTTPFLPRFLARVPGLRTFIQTVIYLLVLLRWLPRTKVVHVLAASRWYFFLRVVPAVLLGRLFACRVVLNYRGGAAPSFFSKWKRLVHPILRRVAVIVVPSRFLERLFQEHGFQARIIPNLIDLARFHYKRRSVLRPYLLVSRNLEPVYDVQTALRAFERIKQRYPAARIDVVGSGSQEAQLKNWVQTHALKDVNFHGAVPNHKIPSYLDQADILLNASQVDNMPITLLEAFASGIPVVTTAAGGIPDLLAGKEIALLVEPGDDEAMAEMIERLLMNPELAEHMSSMARKFSEGFSWNSIRNKWQEAYAPPPNVPVRPGNLESECAE